METSQTKNIIGIVLIIIFMLLAALGFIMNSKSKKNLNAEKLRSESLLSEKLLVEKELERVKNDLASLQSKNEADEKTLAELRSQITDKDRRIASLSRQNNTLTNDNAELAAIKQAKENLDNEYAALKNDYERLVAQKDEMQKSISALEADKENLEAKLEEMNLYDSDNFMVYGSRGKKKEKLTFWACRTKKLNINFEVPQSLTENINFRITTPGGSTVTPENASLTWDFAPDPRNFTASLSSVSGDFEQSRTVSLTYASKEKLPKGEYKIQILCNDITIGNCRVRLK
jgi:myosin heavy subunit